MRFGTTVIYACRKLVTRGEVKNTTGNYRTIDEGHEHNVGLKLWLIVSVNRMQNVVRPVLHRA